MVEKLSYYLVGEMLRAVLYSSPPSQLPLQKKKQI